MIHYPTIEECRAYIFPLIRERMAIDEPAPRYEFERIGVEKIEGIFSHMHWPQYESILQKGAYLFCSIIGGHPFSNGNKRLAVGLLVYFLLSNGYHIHAPNLEIIREGLKKAFPKLRWKRVESFSEAHEYFFYHLALIIADRTHKGSMNFEQERTAVTELLSTLFIEER